MLKKCSNVLLLTNVTSFAETYTELARDIGVSVHVEEEWNSHYRVSEQVIVCGSKYIEDINEMFIPNVVVILRSGENPAALIKRGINRFIFDFKSSTELLVSMYAQEKEYVKQSGTFADVLDESPFLNYVEGEYKFNFKSDRYYYKGDGIYLTNAEKRYLAEWLLNGHKDNSKRQCLFNMRKKFGNGFLKGIDRFGKLKEKKNEW